MLPLNHVLVRHDSQNVWTYFTLLTVIRKSLISNPTTELHLVDVRYELCLFMSVLFLKKNKLGQFVPVWSENPTRLLIQECLYWFGWTDWKSYFQFYLFLKKKKVSPHMRTKITVWNTSQVRKERTFAKHSYMNTIGLLDINALGRFKIQSGDAVQEKNY